jgi:hypothetical protein
MTYIKRGSHFLALVWLFVSALLLPQPPALGDLDIRFDYRYDTRGGLCSQHRAKADSGGGSSPESEADLNSDEVQHTVTLTQGLAFEVWRMCFQRTAGGSVCQPASPRAVKVCTGRMESTQLLQN